MAETWTRHERPDGHRSLWFKAVSWVIIELAHMEPHRLWVGTVGDTTRTYSAPDYLDAPCRMRRCPVPTAADLAWLRGE